jgi:hypothetical protein
MESEQRGAGQESEEQDMPHGHEGSERPGGQVGVGVGGLGGGQPGGTQSDQGRGYGGEGGSERQSRDREQETPHGHEGSDRGDGGQVGVGTGGLGGREWSGRREESSGEGDDTDAESTEG